MRYGFRFATSRTRSEEPDSPENFRMNGERTDFRPLFFVSPVPGLPFLSGTGVVHALHLCGNFLFYRFQVPCRSSIFPSPVGFFGRKGWLPRRFRRFEVHFRENSSFLRKCNFPEKASERACPSAPRSTVKPERLRKGMPNRGTNKTKIDE